MKEIVCVGSAEFTLGFKLAGIRRIINGSKNENWRDTLSSLTQDSSIGIVIIDENVLSGLEPNERSKIEDSVSPVFISLSSDSAASGDLRKLIIKSIGVDLLKGEA